LTVLPSSNSNPVGVKKNMPLSTRSAEATLALWAFGTLNALKEANLEDI